MGKYMMKRIGMTFLICTTPFSLTFAALGDNEPKPTQYRYTLKVLEDRGGHSTDKYFPKNDDAKERIKERFDKINIKKKKKKKK